MAGRPRDNWSWPTPGGHGRPRHPALWESPDTQQLAVHRGFNRRDQAQPRPFQASGGEVYRRAFPAGAMVSRWYRSLVAGFHGGQMTTRVGGSALHNRVAGLPPKTVRPAFTGPYERKFAKCMLGHNRRQYQPLEMLPSIKRPTPQAVRHSQAPRVRPALQGGLRQRYSVVTEDQILANAKVRAGGRGRIGARAG